MLPKIYQCNAKILNLRGQNISFNDFIFLGSKSEDVTLVDVSIEYDDGSMVPLEKILAALPQLKHFHCRDFHPHSITPATVEEMLKIPQISKLEKFLMDNITENFDIESFFLYIKNKNKTKWNLWFCEDISEEYRARLQAIVNEIVTTENHVYQVPFILSSAIDKDALEKLANLSMEKMKECKHGYKW